MASAVKLIFYFLLLKLIADNSDAQNLTSNPQSSTPPTSDLKSNLFPSFTFCGLLTNKTSGPAEQGKYPWLAYLEYHQHYSHHRRVKCLGTLINRRYVLTAAQCVNRTSPLVSVMLGGHDYEKDPKMSDDAMSRRYYIEKTIMHRNYSSRPIPANDIALIRLNSSVSYSDYILPVCLPRSGMASPVPGDILMSSTMNQNKTTWPNMIDMDQVTNIMISHKECSHAYAHFNLTVRYNHLCTRTSYNSTYTCVGDGGGPLTFRHNEQYQQEGIVSYARECEGSFPKVNTKVDEFMKWIMENMH